MPRIQEFACLSREISAVIHQLYMTDWEKQEEMGQETYTLSWGSAPLARAATAWLQIASPLWAPGISTAPFTAKETRQAVKNSYTVKNWKGQGGGDPHCRSQQPARDKVMARNAHSREQRGQKHFKQQKVPHLPSPQKKFVLTKGTLPASVIRDVNVTPMFAIPAWDTGMSLSCPPALHTDCQQQIKLSVHRHAAINWWNKEIISKKKKWDLLAFYLREKTILGHMMHDATWTKSEGGLSQSWVCWKLWR